MEAGSNIISNVLQNVANLSGGAANTLLNMVPVVHNIDVYNRSRNSIFYHYGFGPYWHCNPWCMPMPPYPQDYIYQMPLFASLPQYQVQPQVQYQVQPQQIYDAQIKQTLQQQQQQYQMQPQQQYYTPQYKPDAVLPSFAGSSNPFQTMDMLLNPQCYNTPSSGGVSAGGAAKEKPKEEAPTEPVVNYDAQGNDTTPNWYNDLKQKQKEGKSLTPNEKQLIKNYENMSKNYSIYAKDSNGNMIQQANGQYKMSALVSDIQKIENLANGWGSNTDAIAKIIKGMSPEKLAALEHYFPQVTGKQLREVIKDSAAWYGTRWMNINYASSNQLLDYIDQKVAMSNPSNMARALYQAINNHRIWGLGVDEDRIVKLISMAARNKEFLAAVQEEYSTNTGNGAIDLINDINDKWGISAENKNKLTTILSQTK